MKTWYEILNEESMAESDADSLKLMKYMEKKARNPEKNVIKYKNFDDFMKKEVGGKTRGKYYYKGYSYTSAEKIKSDLNFEEVNKSNKEYSINNSLEMIKDVKMGKYAVSIKKDGKIYIVYDDGVKIFDDVRKFRKEIFNIEDEIDMDIKPFESSYNYYTF
jgi:hypothetical protein